jgi:hypothetical protein
VKYLRCESDWNIVASPETPRVCPRAR